MQHRVYDWALVIGIALLGPLLLLVAGGSTPWLYRGALSWLVALGVKLPASAVASTTLFLFRAGPFIHGLSLGLLSALAEMGVAWYALEQARTTPTLPDILTFAAAAGSVEALALLVWGLFSQPDPETLTRWEAGAAGSRIVRHQFAIERGLAWLGHLGSRGLFTVGWLYAGWWPCAIAVATFALNDGLASYGHAMGWNWTTAEILKRYYGVTTILVGIELVLLALVIASIGMG